MKNLFRLFLIVAVGAGFAVFWGRSEAQSRDNFLHNSKSHKKLECSSCHKVPTRNWISARGYPDVADYPGHAACFSCHKSDFFAGNKPAICASCHASPGPRGAARLPFPVRTRATDFTTIFPHDVHQNILASNTELKDVSVAHFTKVQFSAARNDQPSPQFNNCATCHRSFEKIPKFRVRDLLKTMQPLAEASKDEFAPTPAFFKTGPDSHASCFACHYQNQKPIRSDCAGCHRLAQPHVESRVVTRYSLKFNHQSSDHVKEDCTTCHIRITQVADLNTMKGADVPILTCSTSSCHGSKLSAEIAKREASSAAKESAFQCTYCHTTQIGRFPIPASHNTH